MLGPAGLCIAPAFGGLEGEVAECLLEIQHVCVRQQELQVMKEKQRMEKKKKAQKGRGIFGLKLSVSGPLRTGIVGSKRNSQRNHTDSDFERNRYVPLQRGLARLYVMWL